MTSSAVSRAAGPSRSRTPTITPSAPEPLADRAPDAGAAAGYQSIFSVQAAHFVLPYRRVRGGQHYPGPAPERRANATRFRAISPRTGLPQRLQRWTERITLANTPSLPPRPTAGRAGDPESPGTACARDSGPRISAALHPERHRRRIAVTPPRQIVSGSSGQFALVSPVRQHRPETGKR